MAFKLKVIKTIYGRDLIFDDAYHQVTHVAGDKERIDAQITVYTDESKAMTIEHKNVSFVPDTSEGAMRWDKQTYEYAKTLDAFEGAIDC